MTTLSSLITVPKVVDMTIAICGAAASGDKFGIMATLRSSWIEWAPYNYCMADCLNFGWFD